MQQRYTLRFESGERAGESIPITEGGFVVGRKPGSSLQILDSSVSGRHAEIVVSAAGCVVKDLGSTNGTRIGTQRVLEESLAHGDEVLFGNIRLTFLDAEFDAGAPAAAPAQEVGEAVGGISSDRLKASKKRSFAGLLVIVVLLAGLVGAWFLTQKGGDEVREVRPVVAVAGDLLKDFSFEAERQGWSAHEAGESEFLPSSRAAYSGETGMRASLEGTEWALARSETVRVQAGRKLTLRGALRSEDAAEARVGVQFLKAGTVDEFGDETPPVPGFYVWSADRAGVSGFEEVTLEVDVAAGYDLARACLFAAGDGVVDADDVSLVQSSGSVPPAAKIGEFEFHSFGEEGQVVQLHKVDRLLISDLEFRAANQGTITGRGSAITPVAQGDSIAMNVAPGAERLSFKIEPDAREYGVATLGASGYQLHSADFERSDVESILVAVNKDLARLRFAGPKRVSARLGGGVMRVTVEDPGAVTLQLDFQEERVQAGNLAYEAKKAESEGRLGACLASWQQLLDEFPYESTLVQEADEVRGRLIRQGLGELQDVGEELRRARFFRLVEMFTEARTAAGEIAERYSGSEVESAARELVASITDEVSDLERDLESSERGRLEGIHRVLVARQATGLASEVEDYLKKNFRGER